ncbi:hypothetical protein RhiXN_11325 [Rhizoctonia solani]|uniref:Uncharacterized protein n=1 Tax=Rhizoctonia solani TaxID=456999 RepID=A0A8H8P5Y4_9AGAM|nr:uncharacterized protein RhiXN_11325 [Rhizoctonia solani]QRW24413.1 hypothetical protein RhiXN_11325 [Rhizoctonia solani]
MQRGQSLWVYSEDPANAAQLDDVLHLDAYDFFRVCAEDPDSEIPTSKCHIQVPLKSLRAGIAAAVIDERRELAEKKCEPRAELAKPKPEGKQRSRTAMEALGIPDTKRGKKIINFAG